MKHKLTIVIAIAIVTLALFACGDASSASNSGVVVTATTQQAQPTPQTFKVGQSVKIGTDWQVTVNKAKTSKGGQFDSLKPGDDYLEIDVSMKNLSSKEQDVSSALFWTLQDSTGQKYDLTFASDSPATPDGKVSVGSTIRGTLTYEVPVSQKEFSLNFSPDLFSSGQTTWAITV